VLNRNSLLLTLCVAAFALPVTASAEADGPDWWSVHGVAADDVLNLRAKASPHADKLGEIPPGANCVRNLGCQGGLTLQQYTELSEHERKAMMKKHPRWCQVEYDGVRGWVSGHFLREGTCTDTDIDTHAGGPD
jgi:uncharacterized protein YgiM (DUF1202 family)